MKTPRSVLESQNKRQGEEIDCLSIALHDTLCGVVKWFGSSRTYSIGITRPCAASGGFAIVRSGGAESRAVYWEKFARNEAETIAACITGEDTEYNRELLRRRSVLEAAQAYVTECQRSA